MIHRRLFSFRPRLIAPWVGLSLLAACGSPSGPAPVIHREASPVVNRAPVVTRPDADGPSVAQAPPVAAPPVAAPPVAAVPPAAATAPAAEAVQSAPVRSARLESRSLEAAPLANGAVSPAPPAVSAPSVPAPQAPAPAAAAPPAPAASPAPSAAAPPVVAAAPRSSTETARSRFVWPATGQITQRFGDPKSLGIAIAGNRGDPVSAAADGKVIFSGLGPKGYGKLLIVKHDEDLLSVYANNSSLLVREGQAVRQGQKIAEVGTSGEGKPRLHFEIRRQGKPVDPLPYLPAR